jgi:hypothetical protein
MLLASSLNHRPYFPYLQAKQITIMGAIVIKANTKSSRILKELAEELGASVTSINEEQYEDLLLGEMMDSEKTGKTVSRTSVMKKLSSK